MTRILEKVKKTIPKSVKKTLKQNIIRKPNRHFKPYIKKKNVEGVAFDFWIGDAIGRDWYDLHCTDPIWDEMRFIRDQMIQPGDVVFECGGHHGCTAIVLSNWVGVGGKVVTFEALPANCDIIEKNIQLNNLQNTYLERKAVGAKHGKITIENSSDSSVCLSEEGLEVELTCLDEYEHLKPTFLKIDVEGFEMQVLQGSEKILSTHPKLAIEVHTDQLVKYGTSVQELLNLVINNNYKVWIQWDDSQQPIEFDMTTPIQKRVHLYGIPCINGHI